MDARTDPRPLLNPAKFRDPAVTAKGETRASVGFGNLQTLWLNTGTLCNITCAGCYIESSPANDRLSYLTAADATPFLDEVEALGFAPCEIGFTGGEPFMNPDILEMLGDVLSRGHRALVLTNAMAPMMRPRVRAGLAKLRVAHGDALTIRVSLDHYSARVHDLERGAGAFARTCDGIDWLARNEFRVAVAGRNLSGEGAPAARAGYAALIAQHGWPVDAFDPASLVLFPEMDERLDVPEITTECWGILGVDPASIMCASSRMVVKRRGEARARVVACTLTPYEPAFDMGVTLADSLRPVALNHPHCARFCVLGGASCSA